MRKTVLATVVVSAAVLAATASLAASDYYLKIEGVEGETASRSKSETIELQSWSFGASPAGVVSPRDTASGLATGKRQHKPMPVTSTATPDDQAALPAAGAIQSMTLVVPEPGDEAAAKLARLCASGKHIKSAVLSGPNGRYRLQDVAITSCAVTGNERRHEFTGHVTLMK